MTEHEKRLVICALQDYAVKCDFLQSKNPFYGSLWSDNGKTARELVRNFTDKRS